LSPLSLLLPVALLLPDPLRAEFDDGRYVNRAAARGAVDLGAEYGSAPLPAVSEDPGLGMLLAAQGGAWWQTRDLETALTAAVSQRWFPGEPPGQVNHRPDGYALLDLDLRMSERVGVDLRGRFLAASGLQGPWERPDPWQDHGLPLGGWDLDPEILWSAADLRPLLVVDAGDVLALHLGGDLEWDRYRQLPGDDAQLIWGPAVRAAAGPLVEARWRLVPALDVVMRGGLDYFRWSPLAQRAPEEDQTSWMELPPGRSWQALGGLSLHPNASWGARLLMGYGALSYDGAVGGVVDAGTDPSGTVIQQKVGSGPGLLVCAELAGEAGAEQHLAAGFHRGLSDAWSIETRAASYGYLRWQGQPLRPVQVGLAAGLASEGLAERLEPRAAGQLVLHLAGPVALALGGDLRVLLMEQPPKRWRSWAALRVGSTEPPAWIAPGF